MFLNMVVMRAWYVAGVVVRTCALGLGAGGCGRKEGRSGDARVGFIGLAGTLGLGFDVGGFSTLRVIASAVN